MTPMQRIERVIEAAGKPGARKLDWPDAAFLATWKKREPESLPSRAEQYLRGLEREVLGVEA